MKLGVVATLDVLALARWQQGDQEFKVICEHSKLKDSLEYKKPCVPNKTKTPDQNSDFSIYAGFSHDIFTNFVPYIVTIGYVPVPGQVTRMLVSKALSWSLGSRRLPQEWPSL